MKLGEMNEDVIRKMEEEAKASKRRKWKGNDITVAAQMDGQTERQTNGPTDERTDRKTDKRMNK